MATRNFVPRNDGEGSIGTVTKQWGDLQAKEAHIGNRNISADGAKLDTHETEIDMLQTKVTTLEHAYAGAKAAATVAEMTDHNQIYVYVGSETGYTNGNWYYWNGTAWTSGGVYNATALETDTTLTVSGAAADAVTVKESLLLNNYGYVINDLTKNLLDLSSDKVMLNKFLDSDGNTRDNNNYKISDFIRIKPGKEYSFNTGISASAYNVFYGIAGNFISSISGETILNSSGHITTPSNASFVRVSVRNNIVKPYVIEGVDTNYAPYKSYFECIKDFMVNNYKTKNIFTMFGREIGYINPLNGTVGIDGTKAKYNTSGMIPVVGGKYLVVSTSDGYWPGIRSVAQFDKNENIIPMTEDEVKQKEYILLNTNTRYIRVSIDKKYDYESVMLQLSDTPTPDYSFVEYKPLLPLTNFVNESKNIRSNLKTTTYALRDSSIHDSSTNMFDINSEKNIVGYFINGSGTFSQNDTYVVSHLIPVEADTTYYVYTNASIGAYSAYYDYTGHVIFAVSNAEIVENNHIFVSPSKASYLRVSAPKNDVTCFVSKENTWSAYKSSLRRLEPAISLAGSEADRISTNSISSGGVITLDNFPEHLKLSQALSFYGKFASFSSVQVGKGTSSDYRANYIIITSTSIKSYYTGSGHYDEVPHGLTISTFINVAIHVDDDANCHVVLNTIGGTFTTIFTWNNEQNGKPKVIVGQDMTDCVFSATSSSFKKPLWIFGDSYYGLSQERIIGQLKNLGYLNFLVDGMAGINSTKALSDLEKCLKFGTPRFLIWGLGMNDNNVQYSNIVKRVALLCDKYNVILILCTIPTVRKVNNEEKKSFVETFGRRYIDVYKAVGANDNGTWYDGYEANDGVHPTELGAKAIAARFLIDAPEIMEM